MELSKQVARLELSQKIKELGVKQESYFVWKQLSNLSKTWRVSYKNIHGAHYPGELIPAYTVAELGKMLPEYVKIDGIYLPISYRRTDRYFGVGIRNVYQPTANTEADARGKMLIYLIENNLISANSIIQ